MGNRERLLARLEEIGQAVKNTGKALALLGLGSVGQELQRLDDYSDLDFFVIAKRGHKAYFLASLNWLEQVETVAFSFPNTADGRKLLFAGGIFCEMAVFEAHELAHIPYSGARIVWQDEGRSLSFPVSNKLPPVPADPPTAEWLIGEILSNLYVGLGRFQRGETLTAARFIQGYAVDRILELAPLIEEAQGGTADPFDRNRRFEQRYPRIAAELPRFIPGYDKSPQAALAILKFIEHRFPINPAMKKHILALAATKPRP